MDYRRIGTINRSIYRMHIGTIIVYIGSSTVLALSGNSRSGIELELLISWQIVGILALLIIKRVVVRC